VRRFLLLLGLLFVAALSASPAEARPVHRPPALILISIDGFRPDYLDRDITPNLSALARDGVRGSIHPSFPSLTFPNHYTLVTGLRPEHHGIVDNTFEDPALSDKPFSMYSKDLVTDRRWWDQGEPLWVTARNQGLNTATMFWPGSEAPIHGVRPNEWKPFDKKMPSAARVDQVLAWLAAPPATRPRFVTLYFDIVDTAGHHGGPGSQEANKAIADVDTAIGRLVSGLKSQGQEDTNIIVVADHGMADVGPDRVVYLDDLLPVSSFRAVAVGPVASIVPTPGHEAEVEGALLGDHDHFACWRKGLIPKRFHYGDNPRIPPIVCLAQTSWVVVTHARTAEHPVQLGGAHGFDPTALEMQAVFVAHGPAFRRGVTLAAVDNVDIYPLMARVLHVRPRPNDGNLSEVIGVLR
jgi:predicted AlkP superfamily pyrophosphatase or phosphodiesterase